MLMLQLRKARDFQRLAEQEKEGQSAGAAGYKGPDGSGQWVSLGELGTNDLDQVLGGLGGGGTSGSAAIDALVQCSEAECYCKLYISCYPLIFGKFSGGLTSACKT